MTAPFPPPRVSKAILSGQTIIPEGPDQLDLCSPTDWSTSSWDQNRVVHRSKGFVTQPSVVGIAETSMPMNWPGLAILEALAGLEV
jgi:hypothetical protein